MSNELQPSNDPEATALAIAYLIAPPVCGKTPEAKAKLIGDLARTMLTGMRAARSEVEARERQLRHPNGTGNGIGSIDQNR